MKDIKNLPLDIIIFGASGDLARKKIFPAFFSLYSRGLMPERCKFFGFARTPMSHEEFRDKIKQNLCCRYTPDRNSCSSQIRTFLSNCFYCRGAYNDDKAYASLNNLLKEKAGNKNTCKLFYLAIPPLLFPDVVMSLARNGFVYKNTKDDEVWSRVIIEKPFGKDSKSSSELMGLLGKVFDEKQTYRIDHYLGKEVVQNLLVFRFANQIFQPLWSSRYIEKIEIIWAENHGVDERGGYFDQYGIIRDVVQNHLFQVLALTAMEEPLSLAANDIIDKKVELLKHVSLNKKDVIIGQYARAKYNGVWVSGYTEDPTVPDDSLTPTYSKMTLKVRNKRWQGMPFVIAAGKGLAERKAEIRITFKRPPDNIFCNLGYCPPANQLTIRIQPKEGFHLNIATKIPGRKIEFASKELDLSYHTAFPGSTLPDAYENLLLDAIKGEKSLFIRNDELQIAWDILTPILHYMEKNKIKPIPYPFGSWGV